MTDLTIINGIKVALIPATEITSETLCVCVRENGLLMDALHLGTLSKPCKKSELTQLTKNPNPHFIGAHAYVLSDKPIKKGHWVYRSDTHQVFQTDFVTDTYINMPTEMGGEGVVKKHCTKIGKTTDRNLSILKDSVHKRLPKLTDDFVQELCHKYNNENVEFYKKLK